MTKPITKILKLGSVEDEEISKLIVCFDSNIYECIVKPDKLESTNIKEKNLLQTYVLQIRELILINKIIPVIPEQTITDELIPKAQRFDRIDCYKPRINHNKRKTEYIFNNKNHITVNINLGLEQDSSKLPSFKDNVIAKEIFNKASSLGFKVLYAPAYILGRSNHDIDHKYFLQQHNDNNIQVRAHNGLGIINTILTNNNAILEENDHAENCDRDGIASCYAYSVKYFCSLDQGGKLKTQSIMHKRHHSDLQEKMDVLIISPKELIKMVKDKDTYINKRTLEINQYS